MKNNLAPKHTQKIGNNYVLWFESSNSYVVISSTAFFIFDLYFEAKDESAFVKHLQKNFDISLNKAQDYFIDLSDFLKDISIADNLAVGQHALKVVPDPNISKSYLFGDSGIRINYSSPKILQLIHPYLHHASVDNFIVDETVFDIFGDGDRLYLFKNKSFVGSYEFLNFHFLQGKFAMELVTSIYNNKESDWLATFHASTICNDHEAIMIIGDSGNGKSTLSAVLMANGFDLLADDFTPMLADNQQLYRFPAAISIKEGAFTMVEGLFEDFSSSDLHISSSKHTSVKYLPPAKSFKTAQKHFSCHKIVMVKYAKDSISELRESPPEKILQTFIPDSWISPQPEHSKHFLNWLKNLKYYELTYSENDFAISKFKELFES